MPTLDELVEDNIVPSDVHRKQIEDIDKAIDDQEVPHQSTQVFTGVDRVHTFPNMENIKNVLSVTENKNKLITALEQALCVSRYDVEDIAKVFGSAVLEALPLSTFSSIPTKTNYKALLKFVKEDMKDDKDKMKDIIRDSLNTFLETAYELHDQHEDIAYTIDSQIKALDNLLTVSNIGESKDRIIYIDTPEGKQEIDVFRSPLFRFISESDSKELTNILCDDLVLFITQVRTSTPPNSSLASLTESIASVRNEITLRDLQEFYQSPNIYPSLSMIYSYIDRALIALKENIKNNEDEMFDVVTNSLPELNEIISNLRYSNNVLLDLRWLGSFLLSLITDIQKRIS